MSDLPPTGRICPRTAVTVPDTMSEGGTPLVENPHKACDMALSCRVIFRVPMVLKTFQ